MQGKKTGVKEKLYSLSHQSFFENKFENKNVSTFSNENTVHRFAFRQIQSPEEKCLKMIKKTLQN